MRDSENDKGASCPEPSWKIFVAAFCPLGQKMRWADSRNHDEELIGIEMHLVILGPS